MGIIALWMYTNDGGNKIQNALKIKLEAMGHTVFNDFDMRECYCMDGNIFTKNGFNLSSVDLFYHMNADEQTQHQNEILQALDKSLIPVVNHWDAFSRTKDKFMCNLLLRNHDFDVPPSALLPNKINRKILDEIFLKWNRVLFKPRSNHGGKGIMLFDTAASFEDFMYAMNPHVNNYYMEKYIDFGEHDYRVEILNGCVVGGYCRTKTHAFKTNISSGGLMTPIEPTIEFKEIALNAAKILGIDATIVDMVKSRDDGKIYILEVNPLLGIFVEEGIRSSDKSEVKAIHSVYANDNLKLDMLANYLNDKIQLDFTKKQTKAS